MLKHARYGPNLVRAYAPIQVNPIWSKADEFQHLDRCVPVARLKIAAVRPYPTASLFEANVCARASLNIIWLCTASSRFKRPIYLTSHHRTVINESEAPESPKNSAPVSFHDLSFLPEKPSRRKVKSKNKSAVHKWNRKINKWKRLIKLVNNISWKNILLKPIFLN